MEETHINNRGGARKQEGFYCTSFKLTSFWYVNEVIIMIMIIIIIIIIMIIIMITTMIITIMLIK